MSLINNGEKDGYINFRPGDAMIIIELKMPVTLKRKFEDHSITGPLSLTKNSPHEYLSYNYPFCIDHRSITSFFSEKEVEYFKCPQFVELCKTPLYKLIIETTANE